MKIEYELTQEDYNAIADIVIQKKSDEAYMKSVFETSAKTAEKKFWHVFEKIHSELEMDAILEEKIVPLIKKSLDKTKLIDNKLQEMLSSDSFKKVTISALREKARQLEKEAEELEGEEEPE